MDNFEPQTTPKSTSAVEVAPGPIERRLALSGERSLLGSAPLELGLTETGLWLFAAGSEAPLCSLHDARYTARAVRADELSVAGNLLSVPLRHKREAREMFALGQIRRASGPLLPAALAGRYVDVVGLVQQAVVRAWLMPGEALLAALQTKVTARRGERHTGSVNVSRVFVASDQRLAVLTLEELGVWSEQRLETGALELERRLGQRWVRRGRVSWRPRGNAERFEELARACALTGKERTLELCRLGYCHGQGARDSALEPLLTSLARQDGAASNMIRLLLRCEQDPEVPCSEVLGRLEPTALARLPQTWVDWQLSESLAERLVDGLAQLSQARQHALTLRRALWQRQLDRASSGAARLAADLAYARSAQGLDASDVAAEVLERRRQVLAQVPLGEAIDVGLEQRLELLEALFDAAPAASAPRHQAALELTQLEPMRPDRFARLADCARGHQAERARECFALLRAEVLAPRTPPERVLVGAPHAIADALLESRLRHPLVRGGAPLFSLIQRAIALSDNPNADLLREHCERLEGSSSVASRALADAATALGVEGVEAFISRGERDIGVRAFDATLPFVLVGGQHLDPSSPQHLSYDELCFALGAELAHLRLGQTRLTSNAVWLGALDKSRQGVELLSGVLPLLHGWSFAGRVLESGGSLRHPLLRRTWGAIGLLHGSAYQALTAPFRRRPGPPGDLTPPNEELLVAHRLMQLSADRAGLVVAGSLQAAVRAILLTRADYAALRRPDPHLALVTALEQEVCAGSSVFTDLSVRIGALAAFYVSEDYATLRAAYAAPAT